MSDLFKIINDERVPLTADEIQEYNERLPTAEKQAETKLVLLRRERNRRIAETDWWVMSDRTATQAQLDYRQALRDITDTYTSLDDVVWPEKP